MWYEGKGYIVRNISAACYLRTPYILSHSLFYIFVFTTRFLMLDMFLTTAGIRMQFPQQKLCQFDFFYSGKDPGIIQHSLSLSCFLGKESSWTYREYFVWYWNLVQTTSFCTTFRESTFLTDNVLNRNHSSFVLWNHFRGIFGDPGNSFSQYPLQNINQEGFCLCFSRSLEITNISRVNAEIFGSEWISNFWKLKWYLKLLNPRSRILRKNFLCLSWRTFSTHPIYNF